MSCTPDITVLIPVRNGERFVADAIESVLRQTYRHWTLVVSDNCSTDGTRAVVGRYLSDPRIRLLENDHDLGMAGNFNRCLDAVATPFYLLLCHDDFLWSDEALALARAAAGGNPTVPAIYSDLRFVAADGLPIMTRSYGRSGLVDSRALARRSVLQTRNLFGIPVLVRTEALGARRYDASLPLALDLDLSIGIAKGRPVYHIPIPLIAYRCHGANHTSRLLKGLVGEITAIGRKHGLIGGAGDALLMRLFGFGTALARRVFLTYAARCSRRAPER